MALALSLPLQMVPGYAQTGASIVQPEPVPRRPSAEFFTTRPGAAVLINVNLWGELAQPGTHFLPVGSSLADAIGASGGPSGQANLASIRLLRSGSDQSIDLFSDASKTELRAGDAVFVPRSVKYDLPIYFGAVSVLVSLLTLYSVRNK